MDPIRLYAPLRARERSLSGEVVRFGVATETGSYGRLAFTAGCFGSPPAAVPLCLQHDTAREILPAEAVHLADDGRVLRVACELPAAGAAAKLVERRRLQGFSLSATPTDERREGATRVVLAATLDEISLVDEPSLPYARPVLLAADAAPVLHWWMR